MKRIFRWYDHLALNVHWLGLNVATGAITPVILPYLVALFVQEEQKNTYLATIRIVSLAVAMLIQPVAGMLSDRTTSRWGRRRPYIFWGTLFNILFLLVVGISPQLEGSSADDFFQSLLAVSTPYMVLLVGIVLVQAAANVIFGALIGLIPDLVPEDQRGRSSGVKAVFELLPAFLIIFIGPLVDKGRIWLVIGIVAGSLLLTMLITILFIREKPLKEKPATGISERVWRLVGLTAIFVIVTQAAVWFVRTGASELSSRGASISWQITLVGLAGLIGMAGSIFIGVYFGAWVGIGKEASKQTSFIWWVINRLLFFAAVGSIQGFALFYLRDYLQAENPATMTTQLLAAVGLFLLPSALGGGYLADRIGRKRLVAYAGVLAAVGTLLLLFSTSFLMVVISGCIIGLGAGAFMATSWALGTDLVPPQEAGRYLGISNLAGAGAGIVGAGIGGPIADFFNQFQPGFGYLVIFAIYSALFLISVATLTRVHPPKMIAQEQSI
jgi:MFS family permease